MADSYIIFSLLCKKSGSLVHIGYQAVQISFEMVYLSIILKSFEKKFLFCKQFGINIHLLKPAFMIDTIKTKTKDIVKIFAAAIQANDFHVIAALLADDGKFETKDEQFEVIETDKSTFLGWLTTELLAATITKIEYDNCIFCRVGNPVILFNDGLFPKMKPECSMKSMNGFMLHVIDNQIKELSFCYSFAHRENRYQFECHNDEVKKLMRKNVDMTLLEAIKIVLTDKGHTNI
jgi:hypothetical protein